MTRACSRARSSGRMGRKGERMSLRGPLWMVVSPMPTLSKSFWRFWTCRITPIEPVVVAGLATMWSEAAAM
ncbi:hypothetical protein D3C87_1713830 [compost metagenome]